MSSTNLLNDLAGQLLSGGVHVVDLTQELSPETPVIRFPEGVAKNSPAFSYEKISEYDEDGFAWYWNAFACGEHTGTHFDAPIHWVTGKDNPRGATNTIDPQRFVGPACVIDCSAETAEDPDFLLTPDHLLAWEEVHGRIPEESWVLMRTDWSKRSGDEFLNVDEDGPHSPGPSVECVKFLKEERNIRGWGSETVGTDAGQAGGFETPFPAHHLNHGANKFGLASLNNLDQLPATGAIIIAAPLKIKNGSGSPLRVLALVPGN